MYEFFRDVLVWIAIIATAWPINVPMLALAFRIQTGTRRLPLTREQLWWRSTFAALFLGLTTIAFVIVDYILTDFAEFPAGPMHMIILAGYVPVAAFILFVMFAQSELFDGLGLFVIYFFLPSFVWLVFTGLLGFFGLFLFIVFVGIIPLGGWTLYAVLSHVKLFDGLGFFMIGLYLPLFLLFLLNQMADFWNPLQNYFYGWIKPVS